MFCFNGANGGIHRPVWLQSIGHFKIEKKKHHNFDRDWDKIDCDIIFVTLCNNSSVTQTCWKLISYCSSCRYCCSFRWCFSKKPSNASSMSLSCARSLKHTWHKVKQRFNKMLVSNWEYVFLLTIKLCTSEQCPCLLWCPSPPRHLSLRPWQFPGSRAAGVLLSAHYGYRPETARQTTTKSWNHIKPEYAKTARRGEWWGGNLHLSVSVCVWV